MASRNNDLLRIQKTMSRCKSIIGKYTIYPPKNITENEQLEISKRLLLELQNQYNSLSINS